MGCDSHQIGSVLNEKEKWSSSLTRVNPNADMRKAAIWIGW